MATQADVRRLALALPGVSEGSERFGFSVRNGAKDKGIAWVWLQRVDPRKARVPCADVLAVRVANNDAKEMLLLAAPDKFFTEPHYDGFPAVLVRLAAIGVRELGALLEQAWAIQAGKSARASLPRPAAAKTPAAAKKAARPGAAAPAKRTSGRPKATAAASAAKTAAPRRPRRAPG